MPRWAIILNHQLLFATDDESMARRFMSLGFQILDHLTGYYVYTDCRKTDARDLLSEEDYLNYWEGQ
jgi:hypothetical protein